MANQTEKMLSTSWNLVRDAGAAVTDAAANSQVGTSLARNLPRIKEAVSVGAGLALARRGGKAAVAVARRNPVAAVVGAVALAGVGLAVAVAKRRKLARAKGELPEAGSPTRRPAVKKAAASKKVAAKKAAPRARKPKVDSATS